MSNGTPEYCNHMCVSKEARIKIVTSYDFRSSIILDEHVQFIQFIEKVVTNSNCVYKTSEKKKMNRYPLNEHRYFCTR